MLSICFYRQDILRGKTQRSIWTGQSHAFKVISNESDTRHVCPSLILLSLSMTTALHSILKQSKPGHLCQVRRRLKNVGSTTGFIVACSDSLVLFHTLGNDTFQLNGYTVLRNEDICEYRFFTKAEYWQFRAVIHFQLRPIRPAGISVTSFPELVKSIAQHYPLITFHPEKKKPDVCYIGPLVSITEQTVTVDDLNSNGEWSGLRLIKISDVTRVDFGGGYEEALAVTAPKRGRNRK